MRTRQLVRDLIRKTPNPERRYINDRGTLFTLAVRAHHDGLRDERVKRARDVIDFTNGAPARIRALAQIEYGRAVRTRDGRRTNPYDMCVVHVSPVKMPRRWPNALPGGTSPRKALRKRVIAWERVAAPMKARTTAWSQRSACKWTA